MANFRAYPGLYLKSLKDRGPIKKGQIVQLLNVSRGSLAHPYFTFVGIDGQFLHTGVDWEPQHTPIFRENNEK